MKNSKALEYVHGNHHRFMDACQPLIENFPVSFFAYKEFLSSAEFFHMSTDLSWEEKYLMCDTLNPIWKPIIDFVLSQNKVTGVFWSPLGVEDSLMETLCGLNYHYFLSIYQKDKGKLRLWTFGGADMASFLFLQSHREILEQFIVPFFG